MAGKILRLYCIHLFAVIAVAVSTYYPGLDIALAILYIIIIGREAAGNTLTRGKSMITALSLHLPGFVLVMITLSGISQGDLSSYAMFILQYWYIPLIPLISLTSHVSLSGMPLYNFVLLLLPVLMSLYYYMVWELGKNKAARPAED